MRATAAAHIFAGPPRPVDGIGAWGQTMGLGVEEVDMAFTRGARAAHDMRRPEVQRRWERRFQRGDYDVGFWGAPCGTFSPRHVPQLRSIAEPAGLESMPAEWRAHVMGANECWRAAVRQAWALWLAGGEFCLEHPQRRYLRGTRAFWQRWADAGIASPGDLREVLELERLTGARRVDIAQCSLGGKFQKFTTLLASPRLAAQLEWLSRQRCARCDAYVEHEEQASGRFTDGSSRAEASGAYPSYMCWAMAAAASACPRGPRRDGLTDEGPWAAAVQAADDAASSGSEDVDPPPSREEGSTAESSGDEGDDAAAADAPDGRASAGPRLSRAVRKAVRRARRRPPRWASLRNLTAAEPAELRRAAMPCVEPVSSERQPPPQNAAPPRPGVGGRPAGRLHISQLFLPGVFQRVEGWRREAEAALQAIKAGRPARPPSDVVIAQAELQPWARGVIWDCRAADDCTPVVPSTRDTPPSGPRSLRRDRLREAAAELGWPDGDLLGQAGEGGLESRSACSLDTVLAFHHPGLVAHFAVAAEAIDDEVQSGALLEGYATLPFVPCRSLPRNVIWQARSRVLTGGEIEDFDKPRVTTDSSDGRGRLGSDGRPLSVNDGVPEDERAVELPTVRALGRGAAIVGEAGAEDGLAAEVYCFDLKAAYRFTDIQVLDWWEHVFFWISADGRGEWRVDPSGAFGGAYMPQRFQGVTSLGMALGRKRVREFDARHPYTAGVQRWQAGRRRLQQAGELPLGEEQASPTYGQIYLDDGSGAALNDVVPVPAELAEAPLGALATTALGGVPSAADSRAAVHLRIIAAVFEWLGFVVECSKTECGSAIVNLGFRVRVDAGRIDCPLPKRRILRRDLGELRAQLQAGEALEQAGVERLVGRLANLTHVLPELAPHLRGGYAVAAARRAGRRRADGSLGRRQRLGRVRPAPGGGCAASLTEMCEVGEQLLEANEGIALAAAEAFPALGSPGTLTTVTDASGEDGVGGYAFHPAASGVLWLLSEEWPADVRAALARAAAPRGERALAGVPTCSMPAAELFGCWAMVAEVAAELPVQAVIAVGDCAPAAGVLTAATSSGGQMRHLVLAARRTAKQWLGVAVPRELNVDADVLSHPSRVGEVERAAEAAGLVVRRVRVREERWATLRGAMALPMGREFAAWREAGELAGGSMWGVWSTAAERPAESLAGLAYRRSHAPPASLPSWPLQVRAASRSGATRRPRGRVRPAPALRRRVARRPTASAALEPSAPPRSSAQSPSTSSWRRGGSRCSIARRALGCWACTRPWRTCSRASRARGSCAGSRGCARAPARSPSRGWTPGGCSQRSRTTSCGAPRRRRASPSCRWRGRARQGGSRRRGTTRNRCGFMPPAAWRAARCSWAGRASPLPQRL